jgi:hypothetical protein
MARTARQMAIYGTEVEHGRLGKQLHRLPNNSINAITDVGQMKRAQPTALPCFQLF